MKITIWVMSLDAPLRSRVLEATKTVLGSSAIFRHFPAVPAFSSVKSEALPDLVIADIAEGTDSLTRLIGDLRLIQPVDLAIVTKDRSPGMFTRAHQLGAVDYVLDPCTKSRLQDLSRRYAALRFSLPASLKVVQADLDKLLPPISHGFSFNDPLDQEILACLSAHPSGISAHRVAQELSLSSSTARRSLEILAQKGILQRFTSLDGTVGRPRILYRLSASQDAQ